MQFRCGALNPSRVDSMPCAVFPARASGVPVGGTRLGRVSYRVEDGNTALVVSVGVVAALFEALLRALGVAALADPLGTAGQRSAAQWSWASAGRPGPRFTSARGHEVRAKGDQE
jgi:glycosyltransferase involved in cell wall biosynthesis